MTSSRPCDSTSFLKFVKTVAEESIAEKNAFVARNDRNEIIAALLAIDITTPDDKLGMENLDVVIRDVLGAAENLYKLERQSTLGDVKFGDILHIFMVAVDQRCSGKGIGTHLVEYALNDARKRNYKIAIAECTNKGTRRILEDKLSFDRVGIIPYELYQDFTEIAKTHHGVAVVEKNLTN